MEQREDDTILVIESSDLIEDERRYPQKDMPSDQRYAIEQFQLPNTDSNFLQIFVTLDVFKQVWEHAKSDVNKELGGILLGGVFSDGGILLVEITGMLDARHARQERANFTFTHETWDDLTRRMRSDFPDKTMVGWYHTHPRFGIFVSDLDKFIHQNVYPKKTDVALVIDPINIDYGFFQWHNGQLSKCPGFKVFTAKQNAAELEDFVSHIKAERNQVERNRRGPLPTQQRLILIQHENFEGLQQEVKYEIRDIGNAVRQFFSGIFKPYQSSQYSIPEVSAKVFVPHGTNTSQITRIIEEIIASIKTSKTHKIHLDVYEGEGTTGDAADTILKCKVDWAVDGRYSTARDDDIEYTRTGALITWCGDTRIRLEPSVTRGARGR